MAIFGGSDGPKISDPRYMGKGLDLTDAEKLALLRTKLDEWHMDWTNLHEKLDKAVRSSEMGQAFTKGSATAIRIGLHRLNALDSIFEGKESDESV